MSVDQRSRPRSPAWIVFVGISTLFAIFGGIAACGSDGGSAFTNGVGDASPEASGLTFSSDSGLAPASDGGGDTTGQGDDGGSDDGGTLSGICADASADPVIDCTGKCGPVKDLCSGKVAQCGGCDQSGGVKVCDLNSNTCITPQITCEDLGAECGTLKNSCGVYLDCPSGSPKGCATGKECNDDTHKCQDCETVTCQDLGIQCGKAWLGCGPNTADNFTDCGTCANDAQGNAQVCNPNFNICEPKCTPQSAATICNAAKATLKAVECGIISDGCGGTVNCDTVQGFGCPAGEACGVHGIANRCSTNEIPDECKATGKNCGTTASLCGGTVTCGDCPTGQVCNTNGVCGAPCAPKTCATDFADKQCGTFQDGCGGTVTCGTCNGGTCDQTTNTCCTANTCATSFNGKCGDGLAAGCGSATLNCDCTGGKVCTQDGNNTAAPAAGATGLCCTPKTAATYTGAGQCGSKLSDGCGGTAINAGCATGQECITGTAPGTTPAAGVIGTCCTPSSGACTADPTKCASVADSCLTGHTVSCTANCTGGKTCDNGECCIAAVCTGGGAAGGECNTTEPGTAAGCSGKTCACNGGLNCLCNGHLCGANDGKGVCTKPKTCGDFPAGTCGTNLDDGAGGTVSCNCSTGNLCSSTTSGTAGTCSCKNGLGAAYTCANVPKGGDACGTFDNGCGGTVTCGCSNGQTCDTATTPKTCCSPTACPTAAVGSVCGSVSNGCGGTQSCGCPTNDTCNAGTCCAPTACPAAVTGGKCGAISNSCGGNNTCGCPNGDVCNGGTCCAPTQCPAQALGSACGSISNSCGGNNSCGCPNGDVCDNTGKCCAPTMCTDYSANPAAALGQACGQISNSCGGNNSCSCPSGTFDDAPLTFTCTAGKCACTPDTCKGRSGQIPDGCGNLLTCKS